MKKKYWVSNPFRTGRYCAVFDGERVGNEGISVSNPFRTGRYCAEVKNVLAFIGGLLVSNPFRTGRYCAARVPTPS